LGRKQIVTAHFLVEATAPQINGQGLYFYGYQFWLGRSFISGREIDWSAAVGSAVSGSTSSQPLI
jgi:hypothetical protein